MSIESTAIIKTNFSFNNQTNFYRGKVRDTYTINDKFMVMVASDRISAFDHILPRPIPYKGQVLNQIAIHFLEATRSIVPNWFVSSPDPNVAVGLKCEPFRVEMVIRGYLTGHAWRTYRSGKRTLCGVALAEGLKENDRLPEPIITPSTKAMEGHDEDIDAGRIIRFSQHSKWLPIHKIQKYYSIFLYGLLTINWAITTDIKQMHRYLKRKLSYGKFPNPATEWTKLVISKVIYYSLWIVLPLLVLDVSWWKVLIGFFVMHYTAGMILSLVFQLAHIVPKTTMPIPDKDGNLEHTWAVHQLYTTSNFAPSNWLVNFYTGGLNHQVEHHIFPHISHVHYSKLAKIVKETAKEFNLPYNEYKTTRRAIIEHFKHLGVLGKKPEIA